MKKLPALMLALPLAFISSQANSQQTAKLDQLFQAEMLNANLRYFESIAGVARESWEDTHSYNVDGCTLEITAPQGRISSLSVELNDNCGASLKSFLGDSFSPDESRALTFGNFTEHTGDLQFHADCLSGCGNAYDPSVYAFWEGPRAVNFMQLQLEVKLVSGAALDAANQWEEAISNARGEEYVMLNRFNCEDHFDPQASAAFHDVVITRMTVGSQLQPPGC